MGSRVSNRVKKTAREREKVTEIYHMQEKNKYKNCKIFFQIRARCDIIFEIID